MSVRVRGLSGWWLVALLSIVNLAATSSDLRLVEAVQKGNRQAVPSLLKENVDVNASQADGATALHWAAHRDDQKTAELLIGAGANVNAVNAYGITPLSLACTNGSPAMVHKLLEAGADPNAALPTGPPSGYPIWDNKKRSGPAAGHSQQALTIYYPTEVRGR
jgi:hypothetical protein